MNKIQQLARDVKELESQLAVCTHCGMCQANCPLFAHTRKEADVSRGKLALINGLIEQVFDDAQGVNERLQRCLLCGSCSHGCPSSVNALEIFLKARAIIAQYLGLPFSKKLVFKKILSNPRRFNFILKMAVPFQKIFFKTEKNAQGTSCARMISPLLKDRHIIPLKTQPFNKTLLNKDFRVGGKGVKVAFFVGCLIDKAFPNIAHSVVDVLRYFNAQVFIPSDQGCCGIPAIANGDLPTFKTLVNLNVDLFSKEKFDYLVTACATCSSTIIKLWTSLAKTSDTRQMRKISELAEKTVDISWLMARRFDLSIPAAEDKKKGAEITYHDPCHLKKSLGISQEPRQVILGAGNTLVEMLESDTCCGMGGSFNLQHYDLSSVIGSKKAENIINTGCSTVATSCPACMMQLSDMLAEKKQHILVRHPVEIYADALTASNKL